MFQILIAYLIRIQQPFSILLDSTQDVSGQHLRAIHSQVLENNIGRVYFFLLLEVGADESASGLWNLIVESIEKEGPEFIKYFKPFVVGYGSDGANVFTGHHNSGLYEDCAIRW